MKLRPQGTELVREHPGRATELLHVCLQDEALMPSTLRLLLCEIYFDHAAHERRFVAEVLDPRNCGSFGLPWLKDKRQVASGELEPAVESRSSTVPQSKFSQSLFDSSSGLAIP